MEICQKSLTLRVLPYKATQGRWNQHRSIGHLLVIPWVYLVPFILTERRTNGPICHNNIALCMHCMLTRDEKEKHNWLLLLYRFVDLWKCQYLSEIADMYEVWYLSQ